MSITKKTDKTIRLQPNSCETPNGIPFSAIDPDIGMKTQAFHELVDEVYQGDPDAEAVFRDRVCKSYKQIRNKHTNLMRAIDRVCAYILPDYAGNGEITSSEDLQSGMSWLPEDAIVKYAANMLDSCFAASQIEKTQNPSQRLSIAANYAETPHPVLADQPYPFVGTSKTNNHIVYGTTQEFRLIMEHDINQTMPETYTTKKGNTVKVFGHITSLYPNADSETTKICNYPDKPGLIDLIKKTPTYRLEPSPLFKAALCSAATPLRPGEKDADVLLKFYHSECDLTYRITYTVSTLSGSNMRLYIDQDEKTGRLTALAVKSSTVINDLNGIIKEMSLYSKDIQNMCAIFANVFKEEQVHTGISPEIQHENNKLVNILINGGGLAEELFLHNHTAVQSYKTNSNNNQQPAQKLTTQTNNVATNIKTEKKEKPSYKYVSHHNGIKI